VVGWLGGAATHPKDEVNSLSQLAPVTIT